MPYPDPLDTAPTASQPNPRQTWNPLQVFSLYRLALAAILVVLDLSGVLSGVLGRTDPRLFTWVSSAYLTFALLCGASARFRWPAFRLQVYGQIATDIAAVTALMHASGGINNGLGILILVSIAGGSLLLPGRAPFLFAALGSLAVLAEQMYAQILVEDAPGPGYTQTGLLGVAFFATAALAAVLTQRIRASEFLAAARAAEVEKLERLNKRIIQQMRLGVLVIGDEERVQMMNQTAQDLLGIEQGTERSKVFSISPPLNERWRAWLLERTAEPQRFRDTSSGRDLLLRFSPLGDPASAGTLLFLEDTAIIDREAQQLKLASLGHLTGSIAHEIRNPLATISHAAQMLEESPSTLPCQPRLVTMIREQARRINTIIEGVIQLSDRQRSRPEELAFRPWIEQFRLDFLQERHADPSQVTIEWGDEEATIVTDPADLRQILTNLCDNAWHFALKQTEAPQITLAVGRGNAGRGIYLEVADNGPGIDVQLEERMFEPFFTTEQGRLGLGLYIARELCHNNRIQLDPVPAAHGGARFRLHFTTHTTDSV